MAYDSLKNIIRQYIKTNGEQEITGQIMQNVLIEMVNNYPILDGYATQAWVNQQGYVTSSALAGYLPLTGGTLTGNLGMAEGTNIDITLAESSRRGVYLTLGMHTVDSTDYCLSLQYSPSLTPLKAGIDIDGNMYGEHFIVNGGTSSQFLKADGNVDSNSYLPLTGGTMTGSINFTSSAYGINFTDGSQGIGDISYSSLLDGLLLHSNTKIVLDCNTIWAEGNLTATSFIKNGGTSSQFLKADGSVDSNTYITSAALAGYLPLTGGTMTGSINFTSSAYGINFSNGSQGSGDIGWSSDYAGVSLHSNTKIVLDSGTIWAEGNLTATSFIKDGGTSSQFLKADGSVDSNTYITSAALASYLPLTGGTMTGSINFTSSAYGINFTDGSQGIGDISYSSLLDGLLLHSNTKIVLDCNTIWAEGNLTATSFIKDGGTSAQFLKADGSVDSNTYITSASLAGYLPLSGGTMTGKIYNFENRIIQWTDNENDNNSWGTSWYGLGRYFETQGSLYVGVLAISNYWGINLITKNNSSVFVNGNVIINSANIGSQSVNYATSAGNADTTDGYHLSYRRVSIMRDYNTGTFYWYRIGRAQAYTVDIYEITVYSDVNFPYQSTYRLSLSNYADSSNCFELSNITHGFDENYGSLFITADSNYVYIQGIGLWTSALEIRCIRGTDRFDSDTIGYGIGGVAGGFTPIAPIYKDSGICRVDIFNSTYGYNSKPKIDTNIEGNATYATTAGSVAWSNVSGRPTALSSFTNDSGYITSSGSCAYATYAGSANILGHTVSEDTAHSLSNGDTLVYDAGVAWVNVPSGLSDIRQKSVISYEAEPMFEAVANAPAIRFTWKDATYSFRRGIHVGSIAQYWQTTIPEAVTMDNEGMLSMQYDVIALLSTISVAKKVSEHERRIVILERENEELRKELAALKSA